MSSAVTTRPTRRRRGAVGAVTPEAAGALRPVVDALMTSARSQSAERIARAESDASARRLAAREEADSFVAEAVAEATEAEERAAALRLAATRRAAHEIVLAARRGAYEALREAALGTLLAQADSPEGRLLAQRIGDLVSARIGGTGVRRDDGSGAPSILSTVAESGHRRARVEATSLIDAVLETMPEEIEQLWS